MKMLSTKEAAERLCVHVTRIHQLIKKNRLPAEKVGRDWVIREKDLEKVAIRRTGRPPGKKAKKRAKKPTTDNN